MARLPLGGTIDFIGQSRVAGALSAIVILVGLVAVVGRGRGLMDIDFTGGVSIQAMFNQDQDIEQIRTTLTARDDVFDDLAVSELNYPGNPPHRHYVINTSSPDAEEDADKFLEKVKLTLQEIYGDKLVHHSMTITPAASAASAAPASATPSKPEQSDTGMRDDLPPENLLAAADSPPLLRSARASASADPEPSPAAESAGKSAGPEEAPSKPEPKNESAPAKPAAETAAEERLDTPKGVEATTWTVDFGEANDLRHLEQEIQAQIKRLGAAALLRIGQPGYARTSMPIAVTRSGPCRSTFRRAGEKSARRGQGVGRGDSRVPLVEHDRRQRGHRHAVEGRRRAVGEPCRPGHLYLDPLRARDVRRGRRDCTGADVLITLGAVAVSAGWRRCWALRSSTSLRSASQSWPRSSR